MSTYPHSYLRDEHRRKKEDGEFDAHAWRLGAGVMIREDTVPRQRDGNACGVFVLSIADCFSQGMVGLCAIVFTRYLFYAYNLLCLVYVLLRGLLVWQNPSLTQAGAHAYRKYLAHAILHSYLP